VNGSGANVAGCATCHGRCCREYRVEVNVADVRRLATGTTLRLSDFLVLRPCDGDKPGFRLRPGGPGNELNLVRRPRTGGCIFLLELSPTEARCGVYPFRPSVCSNFPTTLKAGVVSVRPEVTCGPNSWSLAAMDLPAYRQGLAGREADWIEHWRILEVWNKRVETVAMEASPEQLYDFLVNYSPAPSGTR
jgi:Fe-S-cluster containining protein